MSTETIEKLQSEIVILKSRILDTQDAAARISDDSKLLQNTLAQIAQLVGITSESVKLEDLVEAVRELVKAETAEEE
ncbi:chaperone for both short and long tail fibers [Escherichia phage vB-Eco-KMB38]|uniref:Tail fiber assembly helper protein n=1 Tax=Escherichia phage PTK TaxID=2809110 RepID=A0A899ILT4_9CAUD|nr:tail fiber assembly helper protein [Escherichia phage PTK]QXV75257.1 short and long tail fiber chaperone [Escherichia phage AlbertHofmann]WQN07131.1 chaperone for both short and long tail fibers [Escherichia phage vB-Eco-KMB38]